MNLDEPKDGLVLVCDAQGSIHRVIRNTLSGSDQLIPGQMLISLVDHRSVSKMLSMLVAIKNQGASFDWELNVCLSEGLTTMQFGGAVINNDLVIFGSKTRNGLMQLYEELLKISNEQATLIRQTAQEQSEKMRLQDERDRTLFDELSRLNNELVTLQRELAKKNAELEKLHLLKNQFLGMAAHDLRTPLGHILTYSEFLFDEASEVLNAEHREFLSIIQASSNFMLQMVNDLLDVAQIESGKLELNLELTDLIVLVSHNVTLNNVLAQKKNIALQFAYDPYIPHTFIDPSRIEQVLNNLISNAVKFSYPHHNIEVNLNRNQEKIVLSVKDQGQGIPPDQLDRLFKPFHRTRIKGTQGEKSTGLGLNIAKKIVTEHKGEIWVESLIGVGSTFYVSLPIRNNEEVAN